MQSTIESNPCVICLDDIISSTGALLNGCMNHLFHIDCIKKWASEAPTCPLCKNEFQKILYQGIEINVNINENKNHEDEIEDDDDDEDDPEEEERCCVCGETDVDEERFGEIINCRTCHNIAHKYCIEGSIGIRYISRSRFQWRCYDCIEDNDIDINNNTEVEDIIDSAIADIDNDIISVTTSRRRLNRRRVRRRNRLGTSNGASSDSNSRRYENTLTTRQRLETSITGPICPNIAPDPLEINESNESSHLIQEIWNDMGSAKKRVSSGNLKVSASASASSSSPFYRKPSTRLSSALLFEAAKILENGQNPYSSSISTSSVNSVRSQKRPRKMNAFNTPHLVAGAGRVWAFSIVSETTVSNILKNLNSYMIQVLSKSTSWNLFSKELADLCFFGQPSLLRELLESEKGILHYISDLLDFRIIQGDASFEACEPLIRALNVLPIRFKHINSCKIRKSLIQLLNQNQNLSYDASNADNNDNQNTSKILTKTTSYKGLQKLSRMLLQEWAIQ